ncbi:spliceosome-associated protein CWC27 homolog [Tachysurus ichikawai]
MSVCCLTEAPVHRLKPRAEDFYLLFLSLQTPPSPQPRSCRMSHVLQFDEQSKKVKDANMHDEDTFEIYDPRNPVNKRRREESKKLLKEKKAKW